MITRRTVFILGAGCSMRYSFHEVNNEGLQLQKSWTNEVRLAGFGSRLTPKALRSQWQRLPES